MKVIEEEEEATIPSFDLLIRHVERWMKSARATEQKQSETDIFSLG